MALLKAGGLISGSLLQPQQSVENPWSRVYYFEPPIGAGVASGPDNGNDTTVRVEKANGIRESQNEEFTREGKSVSSGGHFFDGETSRTTLENYDPWADIYLRGRYKAQTRQSKMKNKKRRSSALSQLRHRDGQKRNEWKRRPFYRYQYDPKNVAFVHYDDDDDYYYYYYDDDDDNEEIEGNSIDKESHPKNEEDYYNSYYGKTRKGQRWSRRKETSNTSSNIESRVDRFREDVFPDESYHYGPTGYGGYGLNENEYESGASSGGIIERLSGGRLTTYQVGIGVFVFILLPALLAAIYFLFVVNGPTPVIRARNSDYPEFSNYPEFSDYPAKIESQKNQLKEILTDFAAKLYEEIMLEEKTY